jgi:hypothetical protein
MTTVTAKFIAKSKLIHKYNNGNLKFIYPDSLHVRIGEDPWYSIL